MLTWRAQAIGAQDVKSCDTDAGGCGQLWPTQHFLEGRPPAALTLQLAWESHREGGDAIRDTLAAVQEVHLLFFCQLQVHLPGFWGTSRHAPLHRRCAAVPLPASRSPRSALLDACISLLLTLKYCRLLHLREMS